MSSSDWRPWSSPATTSWSSCTSSQSRMPCSTGSIRSPDSSLDCCRESQQTNAARSRTTLSSSRDRRSFAPIAQTSAPSRSHSPREDRVARSGRGDDDVLAAGVAVRLALLGANPLAELLESFLRPAVDDDVLDRRHGLPDALHLALGLPAAAEDAERRDAGSSEELRGDAARGAGPELAELVRLDHPAALGALEVEQADDERRPARKPRVGLQAAKPRPRSTADMTANAPPSRRCR